MAIRHSLRGGRRLYLDSARSVPALGDAGHGIAGLSIERPGLHEAFVRIVGDATGDTAP